MQCSHSGRGRGEPRRVPRLHDEQRNRHVLQRPSHHSTRKERDLFLLLGSRTEAQRSPSSTLRAPPVPWLLLRPIASPPPLNAACCFGYSSPVGLSECGNKNSASVDRFVVHPIFGLLFYFYFYFFVSISASVEVGLTASWALIASSLSGFNIIFISSKTFQFKLKVSSKFVIF